MLCVRQSGSERPNVVCLTPVMWKEKKQVEERQKKVREGKKLNTVSVGGKGAGGQTRKCEEDKRVWR